MRIKITKKDITWNYAAGVLNIGMGLFILPVVLRMLSTGELGLWYVFSSISGLVSLVDFGFSPTIVRNVTYCWCGAKELIPDGVPKVTEKGGVNYHLLNGVFIASKRIYLSLSLIAAAVMFTVGTLYIYKLVPQGKVEYLVAWLIYALAVIINLYYTYWPAFLKGIGAIKEANQITIYSRLLYVLTSVIGLLLGGGLIWLSAMFLVSGLMFRILSKYAFGKLVDQKELTEDQDTTQVRRIFTAIWPNSKRLGLVTLGSWLITRSSTLLCSVYLGLDVTAKYGLSLQLLATVGSFSSLLFSSYTPELAALKIGGSPERYRQVFARAIVLQWLVGVFGIILLIAFGPIGLVLIRSESTLLSTSAMTALAVVLFLEWNHSTFATLISLSNTVPFVPASLISGIVIVTLSLILLSVSPLGVWSIIISQGLVQAAYNNWYWPRLVLRENRTSLLLLLRLALNDLILFIQRRSSKNSASEGVYRS